jgi:predicted homoserine dehydrogenase-like protein
VGLIGAGKFGSMFLAQVPTTPGLEVTAIADLAPDRARAACREVGWSDERIAATRFVEDGSALAGCCDVEVVVEATGHPAALQASAILRHHLDVFVNYDDGQVEFDETPEEVSK